MPRPVAEEQIYMQVRHRRVGDHLASGWIVAGDLGDYHGQYSVLMQWLCRCPVPVPPPEAAP